MIKEINKFLKVKKSAILVPCVLATLLVSSIYSANAMRSHGDRRGPPQEAFTVCENKSSGDTCEITVNNNKTMSGTCETPRGDKLVCVPEGHSDRNSMSH